ncbi:hypothetical protein FB451DRAFT_1491196 [Mycena latifolia]|nr:hypothetical protein FB451DRAFT_1491196 [Mycena latifolia]
MSSLAALLPLRGIYLQITLLELFMNGLYTGVFFATMYSMVFKKRIEGKGMNIPICLAVVAMYIFSTVHAASRWVMIKNAFIDNGDTPEQTLVYLFENPVWLVVLAGVPFVANTLVADTVLIWRCWTVWNRNFKIIIVPLLLTIAGAVLGFLSVATEVRFILHPEFDRDQFADYATPWSIMSLTTTLSATLLIILRIATMTEGRLRGYTRVIEIVVESAALYCVVLIVYLPFLVRGLATDGYPEAILVQVTGMAPTLIIARVSFGLARPDHTWQASSSFMRSVPSDTRVALSSRDPPSISVSVHESSEFKHVDF